MDTWKSTVDVVSHRLSPTLREWRQSTITPLAQKDCKSDIPGTDLGETTALCFRQAGVELECRQGPAHAGIVVSQTEKYGSTSVFHQRYFLSSLVCGILKADSRSTW